jgi:uncharacterized protein YuzE
MQKQLKCNYDSKYDVLYISVVPNEPAIGSEDIDGVVVRRSRATGEFVGITIFDFKRRLENNNFEGITDYIGNAELMALTANCVR